MKEIYKRLFSMIAINIYFFSIGFFTGTFYADDKDDKIKDQPKRLNKVSYNEIRNLTILINNTEVINNGTNMSSVRR